MTLSVDAARPQTNTPCTGRLISLSVAQTAQPHSRKRSLGLTLLVLVTRDKAVSNLQISGHPDLPALPHGYTPCTAVPCQLRGVGKGTLEVASETRTTFDALHGCERPPAGPGAPERRSGLHAPARPVAIRDRLVEFATPTTVPFPAIAPCSHPCDLHRTGTGKFRWASNTWKPWPLVGRMVQARSQLGLASHHKGRTPQTSYVSDERHVAAPSGTRMPSRQTAPLWGRLSPAPRMRVAAPRHDQYREHRVDTARGHTPPRPASTRVRSTHVHLRQPLRPAAHVMSRLHEASPRSAGAA